MFLLGGLKKEGLTGEFNIVDSDVKFGETPKPIATIDVENKTFIVHSPNKLLSMWRNQDINPKAESIDAVFSNAKAPEAYTNQLLDMIKSQGFEVKGLKPQKELSSDLTDIIKTFEAEKKQSVELDTGSFQKNILAALRAEKTARAEAKSQGKTLSASDIQKAREEGIKQTKPRN